MIREGVLVVFITSISATLTEGMGNQLGLSEVITDKYAVTVKVFQEYNIWYIITGQATKLINFGPEKIMANIFPGLYPPIKEYSDSN